MNWDSVAETTTIWAEDLMGGLARHEFHTRTRQRLEALECPDIDGVLECAMIDYDITN